MTKTLTTLASVAFLVCVFAGGGSMGNATAMKQPGTSLLSATEAPGQGGATRPAAR